MDEFRARGVKWLRACSDSKTSEEKRMSDDSCCLLFASALHAFVLFCFFEPQPNVMVKHAVSIFFLVVRTN